MPILWGVGWPSELVESPSLQSPHKACGGDLALGQHQGQQVVLRFQEEGQGGEILLLLTGAVPQPSGLPKRTGLLKNLIGPGSWSRSLRRMEGCPDLLERELSLWAVRPLTAGCALEGPWNQSLVCRILWWPQSDPSVREHKSALVSGGTPVAWLQCLGCAPGLAFLRAQAEGDQVEGKVSDSNVHFLSLEHANWRAVLGGHRPVCGWF